MYKKLKERKYKIGWVIEKYSGICDAKLSSMFRSEILEKVGETQ
jgi:hypothetical protein